MSGKLGGWSKVKKATEEIQKLCDEVKTEVEKDLERQYVVFKATTYREQVVKGDNFVIAVDVGGGTYLAMWLYSGITEAPPELKSVIQTNVLVPN